jgi:hypothetical protein
MEHLAINHQQSRSAPEETNANNRSTAEWIETAASRDSIFGLCSELRGRATSTQGLQPPCSDIDYQAVEVVENLWHFASAGELLNSEGWTHAVSGFFTKPGHTPRDFRVVANRYGISNISRKGDSVEIAIQSEELGKIDSKLRFITTPTSHMNPDFYIYDLIFGPTPARWYGPDGKTLINETMTGPSRWRIEGSLAYRWTTVNTAVRYVSEARDKSKDIVKDNAEKTLGVLRKYK